MHRFKPQDDQYKIFTFGTHGYLANVENCEKDEFQFDFNEFSHNIYNIVVKSDPITSLSYHGLWTLDQNSISSLTEKIYELHQKYNDDLNREIQIGETNIDLLEIVKKIKVDNRYYGGNPKLSALGNFLFLDDQAWSNIEYNSTQTKEVEATIDELLQRIEIGSNIDSDFLLHLHHIDNYTTRLGLAGLYMHHIHNYTTRLGLADLYIPSKGQAPKISKHHSTCICTVT